MKKFYKLVAAFSLSLVAIGASAQTVNNGKSIIMGNDHGKFTTKQGRFIKRALSSTVIILNYDSADAQLQATYAHNQGQLMNMDYKYPGDTVGGNHNLIANVTVAFDSLVDAYSSDAPYAPTAITIDTVYVPIVHNNHSGVNDTLDVRLVSVDKYGQPTTTTLKDTMIISTTLGGTNSSNMINFLAIPENYTMASSKFAVTLSYSGNKKQDSCWFIYGYGYTIGGCPSGSYALAANTNYSTIDSGKWAVIAGNAGAKWGADNSFQTWTQYAVDGTLPGLFFFIDCNNDGKYDAGDAANYFQNINIFAMVTFPPLGINELSQNGFEVAQNAPNPFNKNSQINYNMVKSSDVLFTIYDMTGRKLVENSYSNVAPGQHVINLSANQFTPGVYFYSFKVNGNVVTKRMVITQ